jgi:site-specific DNA-methyltransferase (adenine-specific)
MDCNLLLGDCLDKLKELDDNSVDSIVTDPPYGLSFMGKKWDYDVPSQDIWEQCKRVLKPGGYLLAFAGSRTYHRMAVKIEDAGFEIRDQIMWIYGSGFPKSLNIGKAVDKKLGNKREVVERHKSEQRPNADKNRNKNKDVGGFAMSDNKYKSVGNSKWEGWGTALKPAHEPIVMARKPLSEKTVVDNVLEWGTGGINIDDSRIGVRESVQYSGAKKPKNDSNTNVYGDYNYKKSTQPLPQGRFPANVIFDEEAGKILDEQSGTLKSGFMKAGTPRLMSDSPNKNTYGEWKPDMVVNDTYGDSGGASRFFYCPKASKKDRNEGLDEFELKQQDLSRKEGKPGGDNPRNRGVNKRKNHHPTVKPTELMLYLIRLVTPTNGITLDPFMGSGSTGKAAIRGGFNFVGIEREAEYFKIAKARIDNENNNLFK